MRSEPGSGRGERGVYLGWFLGSWRIVVVVHGWREVFLGKLSMLYSWTYRGRVGSTNLGLMRTIWG